MQTRIEQLTKIFTSKARVIILQYLFSNEDTVFHVRGLERSIHMTINMVNREVKNLVQIGLVKKKDDDGRSIFYVLNKKHSFYRSLKLLFFTEK